jgi:hypothetical protein
MADPTTNRRASLSAAGTLEAGGTLPASAAMTDRTTLQPINSVNTLEPMRLLGQGLQRRRDGRTDDTSAIQAG